MEQNCTYEQAVYTAVLGKVIGVYLGRPYEGWSREAIQQKWGVIDHYVHEDQKVPLVVPDDDISGTFTFIRALSDSGAYEKTDPAFFGETWLNYLIENKTILWWGGMSHSTEHTAYLRLKHGVCSPESGSMKRNGKEVSEQIGAQIFIDAFGMVAPDRPELAAELARKAAGVSHDGEAVFAAQVVAVMVSLAFREKNMNSLLDAAVKFIPADSLIAQVHRDVRKWAAEYPDWNDTYDRIREKYGYQIYGGNCHVIPNHALMVMAWAYAQNDFFKALSIVCTAGWDTDCNAGNVGSVSALVAGLEHLGDTYDFHSPFADRMYLPTADGTDSVTDVLRISQEIAAMGRKIMGMPSLPAPKNGAWFHFEMPGALHGFQLREPGEATLRNVPAPADSGFDGSRCMEFRFRCKADQPALAETLLCANSSGGYSLISTPVIGGGIATRIRGKVQAQGKIRLRLCLEIHNGTPLYSEYIPCNPDGLIDFVWTPETDGMAEKLGIEASGDGVLFVDSISFSGVRRLNLPVLDDESGWISSMDGRRNRFSNDFTENMRLFRKDETGGVYVTGTRYHGNTLFSCNFQIHAADRAGLLLHYQGMRRWTGILFTKTSLQIVRNCYGETILAEVPFTAKENTLMHLDAKAEDGRISLAIDGKEVISAQDNTFTSGGAGLYVDSGIAGMCDLTLTQEIREGSLKA